MAGETHCGIIPCFSPSNENPLGEIRAIYPRACLNLSLFFLILMFTVKQTLNEWVRGPPRSFRLPGISGNRLTLLQEKKLTDQDVTNHTNSPIPENKLFWGGVQNQLYDESKTADFLGVSKRWLQMARQTGQGPAFVKVGRLVRYRPQDINSWLEDRLHRSTSEEQ